MGLPQGEEFWAPCRSRSSSGSLPCTLAWPEHLMQRLSEPTSKRTNRIPCMGASFSVGPAEMVGFPLGVPLKPKNKCPQKRQTHIQSRQHPFSLRPGCPARRSSTRAQSSSSWPGVWQTRCGGGSKSGSPPRNERCHIGFVLDQNTGKDIFNKRQ